MARLDLSKLICGDGTSVEDRLRALADALIAHGRRGVFILFDKEGHFHVAGHVPESNQELRELLRETSEKIGEERQDLIRTQ